MCDERPDCSCYRISCCSQVETSRKKPYVGLVALAKVGGAIIEAVSAQTGIYLRNQPYQYYTHMTRGIRESRPKGGLVTDISSLWLRGWENTRTICAVTAQNTGMRFGNIC